MKTAMRETYGKTLVELGKENDRIVVLDADLAKSTQTAKFGDAFPERFFDMGIAEQDMMATAAGFAAAGMIPFASTFAMFGSGRPWEQIRNSICYPNLPVKIVVTHAGISVGEDGPTHQACEDIAILRALPNMKIIAPADSVETEHLIKFLVNYTDSPVYIRLSRMKTNVVFGDDYKFEFGSACRMKEGKDVTLLSTGIMIDHVLEAAEALEKDGISVDVIHSPFIKPLDEKTILESVKKTGKAVTVEEHSVIGGFGSAVCELLSGRMPVKVKRIGIQDTFAESGTPEALFDKYGLSAEKIAGTVKEFLK